MKYFYDIQSGALYCNRTSFCVVSEQVVFPIWLDFKGSRKWVVFFPGACRRDLPPPIFQRSSYSKLLEANVISLFDPSLILFRHLTNSWFSGGPQKHYALIIANLLRDFFKTREVDPEDVIYYGSSAGGIPAVIASSVNIGSKVCIANIQVESIRHCAFVNMTKLLFPGILPQDVFDTYRSRFDIKPHLSSSSTLFYFQNISDRFHYKNHFVPFSLWRKESSPSNNVFLYTYDDAKIGHGPISKQHEIELINNVMHYNDPRAAWGAMI
jgi:hypothetical protein